MKKFSVIAFLCVVLFACSHKTKTSTSVTGTPSPKISAAAAAGVTLEEKSALYSASCVRCHKLIAPAAHTKDEWVVWLDKMAPKAKITPEQKAHIYDYLSANAKGGN